jgi:hypothetical protein
LQDTDSEGYKPVGCTQCRIQRDTKTAGYKRCRIQVPKIHALKDTGSARYKDCMIKVPKGTALKDTGTARYKHWMMLALQ